MAHSDKQDSELYEIFQASSEAGADPFQNLLRHLVPQLLGEELTAFLQAEPYHVTWITRGVSHIPAALQLPVCGPID